MRSSLADAEAAEDAVEDVVGVDGACDLSQLVQRFTDFDGQQLLVGFTAGDDQRLSRAA